MLLFIDTLSIQIHLTFIYYKAFGIFADALAEGVVTVVVNVVHGGRGSMAWAVCAYHIDSGGACQFL
jgi:hypothetical protein